MTTYITYLLLTLPTMVWVGRTLQRNGRLFLVDVFDGNDALAEAVNHLLVVGYYLVNLGFIALYLNVETVLRTPRIAIETTFGKVGCVILVLGIMHFFNIIILTRLRKSKRKYRANYPHPTQRAAHSVATP